MWKIQLRTALVHLTTRMPKSGLTVVVPDRMWSFYRPVRFSGVRLRARTTVVRLDDGALLLHSPAPPTDALTDELRALGEVRWLVVPNCFHHLGTPAAAAQYPDARIIGPASALAHNPKLALHEGARLPDEFVALPLEGVPFLDETVLFHRPTQTLLGADLVIGACPEDHWTWRFAARLTGCYQRTRVPPDVRKKLPDKAATARSIRAMLDLPARRLVVAHTDVLEGDACREHLADAWRLEGVEV